MNVRKPRRRVRASAEGFEALYYPQLIDRIFHTAPYQSLLVLRATCKSWKYRADSQIVRCVVVRRKPGGPWNSWVASTTSGPIPRSTWFKSKLVDYVKDVDLLQCHPPAWIQRVPQLQTVRFKEGALCRAFSYRPSSPSPTAKAQPNVVVSLCLDTNLRATMPEIFESNWSLSSLRVIVMGRPSTTPGPGPWRRRRYTGRPFDQLLFFLACRLKEAHASGLPRLQYPVTVINLHSWYSLLVKRHVQVPGFGGEGEEVTVFSSDPPSKQGESWVCQSHDQFRDLLRSRLCDHAGPALASETAQSLVESVTFITLDEYRDEVGEQQLRFETELLYQVGQQDAFWRELTAQ